MQKTRLIGESNLGPYTSLHEAFLEYSKHAIIERWNVRRKYFTIDQRNSLPPSFA